ncbi:MAG: hypothetical protein ACRD1T_03975 [Acidimicrobiia bacterium]
MPFGQPIVPCSYLRIFQPLESFPPKERARWDEQLKLNPNASDAGPFQQFVFAGTGHTGLIYPAVSDHAYFMRVGERWFVCPWRLRLRLLVGLLAFRNTLPVDVAEAFVPEDEAEKAIDELDRLRVDEPDMRAHIATAAWQVPLRWFIAFDESERLVETHGTRKKIRYVTDLRKADVRVKKALEILKSSQIPDGVIDLVEELSEWIAEFPPDSILELDYSTVADLFSEDELSMDESTAELWVCLTSLEAGEFEQSNQRYSELMAWWSRTQVIQATN